MNWLWQIFDPATIGAFFTQFRNEKAEPTFWITYWLTDQPTISLPEKNCAISIAAVSGASEPCAEFSPIDFA